MVTELGLQIALFADEQRHHRVAVVAVDVEGLCHHRQQPAVEVLRPAVVVGGQTAGELFNIIGSTVPLATASEELMDGIIVLDVCRLHISPDVAHPTLPSFFHLLDDNTAHISVCERIPLLETQVVGTELRHLLHHIVAQLIAAREEVLDAAHDALLLVHLR